MNWLDRTKVGAEIAKMLFEIWCMVTDRNKKDAERERRIKELEDRVAELTKKVST
jgi:hypothetical protein